MKREAGEAAHISRNPVVRRPRLTRLLNETTAQVILLVAPAGYGKTTLAREWLGDRPHGWYRGTSATPDLAALALGLARAASIVVPGVGDRLMTRLRSSPSHLKLEDLAEMLIDDLGQWPADAWLVFDDYHFACDSEPAELFVDYLISFSTIRLLVAGRSRPRWASARRVLYGDIVELGRNLLALNSQEAETILRQHGRPKLRGLIAIADGWPALLGLAAATGAPDLSPERPPQELYNYFAEELYQALSNSARRPLRLLALAPAVTPDVVRLLVPTNGDKVIAEATRLGFFLPSSTERLEFHPLLRSFLASKFSKGKDDPKAIVLPSIVQTLLRQQEWDAAFDLIERFFTPTSLDELLEAALPRMIDEARLPTLQRWARTATLHRADSPLIDLTDAELALAGGDWTRAEALALQAARRLPRQHVFKSKAFCIAGTSAHMVFRANQALEYFALAADAAVSNADRRQSLWGRFMTTVKLDDALGARRLLDEFAARSGDKADDLLRVATGRLQLASLIGKLDSTLQEVGLLAPLAIRSRDPLIQSSFLHAYSALLALGGRYQEALHSAQLSLDVSTAYRLSFPLAYARFELGVASLGLRDFRNCRLLLRISQESTFDDADAFLDMNIAITKARLHLATGSHSQALDILDRNQHLQSSQAMKGEYLAWWSLASAHAADPKGARTLSAHASALTERLDVVGLIPWVRAILALRHRRSATSRIEEAWSRLRLTGNVDAFVSAYRGCPELLELVSRDQGRRNELRIILERANDHKLAEAVGLPLPASSTVGGLHGLSKREGEVLELVRQGLMNKEIARALFITEGTVKVHVRKVCQKLGVRSRTEAAMRAAELSG
jgi:ATP/maltotriose-dependent transcriptional regulator MalT